MAATYAYTDTTGRKLTQSAYNRHIKDGIDVSKYTKIEPNVSTSTTTQPTIPAGTPTVLPQKTQPVPTVDPMAKIKELPLYSELLKKWYTEEQISKAVSWYKPPKRRETTVTPPAEVKTETPATAVEPTTTTTAKPEELEATTTDKTQQTLAPLPLSEYKDDSETRQSQIVNNLNSYRQSSPAYMKDLDTFRKTFSYGLRSDTQRTLLDNWYLGYQKWLELNSKNTSDLSSLYSNGNITDSDLEQLRLQNPNKYAEVMALNDKNSTLAKYGDELNGKETSTNPFQSIINNYASNMLSMSTAPSNMFAEYKAAMNSDEMKGMQSQLTDKEWEINQLDLQINQITSNVERRYEGTGATKTKINAIIADETSALYELRNAKAIDYQTLAKKYQNQMTSITDSFDMQIKEQEYNNSQRNQQMQELWFMMELQNYETNEQADEREWNKFIRQQEYQDGNIYSSDPATRRKAIEKSVDRVLAEFEGIPMVRSREQMVADIQKMVDSGTELGEAITQNIRKPIMWKPEYNLWKKNKLGIDTTPIDIGWSYYTQNADGSLSLWKGYNTQTTINGKTFTAIDPSLVENSVNSLTSTLTSNPLREKKAQCWEWVNDWLNTLWIQWNVFDDPINIKKAVINADKAKVWSVIVFDPTGTERWNQQKSKYWFVAWHVGIVTAVDDNGNPTRMADWNRNSDKKYQESEIPEWMKKSIAWYFDPTLWGSSSVSGWAIQKTEPLTDKQFTQSNQIINSFKSDPQVKAFEEAYSQWLSLLSSLNDKSWPWDVAAIFQFMKTLDPSSVVRESEFEVAAKSAWVAEYTKNTYDRIVKGKKLTDKQSEAFAKLAKQYIINKASIYDTKYSDWLRRLDQQWITTTVFPTSMADQMREYLGMWTSQSNTTTNTSNTGTTKNYFNKYKTVTPTKTTSTSYSSSPYFNYISGY